MPKNQHALEHSRRRPVSCRFCRSRKLRCSRDAPCSNCVSRGLRCDLEPPVSAPSETLASESELLERIRRLEELLENQKSQQSESVTSGQQSEGSDSHAQQTHMPVVSLHTEHMDNDVAWLESIYEGQDHSDKISSNKVVFRTCSILQIVQAPKYINQNTFSSTNCEPSRCIWLPQYSEAKILLEKFVQAIDHVHHVVHTPSLPSILDEVYASLNQQGQVKPGNMILLLSIFASCTHCWNDHDRERGIFPTITEANDQSPFWIKQTEDVFDIAHRTTSISIEGVQGIVICSFILGNSEGFVRRCRYLYNMALLLARELGLHRLDHPSNSASANSAQAEIGRRVWWYLVASDWALAARFNGVSQGIYQCHLRHMITNQPLNLNDEDLIDGMSLTGKPWSQPTMMSYPLLRIRLSEISRHIVDQTPLIMSCSDVPSHEVVMDIDTELQVLLNDVPAFFFLSRDDLTTTHKLSPSRADNIFHQGCMFFSLFHSQRCKIHLPFLSRGFTDSKYASSREICIQSARFMIQTELKIEHSGLCGVTRYKFIGFLLGLFMASIVLLVDLCHKKSKPEGEIIEAFRMLEEARHESETAARFLDSVMQILRKHKVAPPRPAVPHNGVATGQPMAVAKAVGGGAGITPPYNEPTMMQMASSTMPGSTDISNINMTEDGFIDGSVFSSYFDELAQTFEEGIDAGSFDWDNIFSGLNSSFI
ncbi:hypothetical protein BDZ45DRAFT_604321 [Acephala macrosclerotiorum]|nr:hypothetical protein BDZ45DRAFT_604321 [Acephala macrosclerotiorum]